MACRRCLRDDDLAMTDAEIGQFEAVGVEGAVAGFHGGIVIGSHPAQYVHRQPGTEQMRERRQAIGCEIVG